MKISQKYNNKIGLLDKYKMPNSPKYNNIQLAYTLNSRGITLIALVITIIILLILATISLQAIFGERRNINRSNFKWRRNK